MRAGAESSTVPCAHCGLPTRPSAGGQENTARQAFCCSGCCLAHHFTSEGVSGSADRILARVLLSAMLAMGVMMLSLSLYGALLGEDADFESESAVALQGLLRMAALAVSAPVMYLLGLPLFEAVVRMRRWLSADALIVLGTASAWAVSVWNTFRGGGEVYYDTATMVLVLVSLGRWLDLRAKERASDQLHLILPERARPATVLRGDEELECPESELEVGQVVRVRPGESVPVDGRVLAGRSFVDTSSLSGEAEPRSVSAGDAVLAGSLLVDGSLDVRAEAVGGQRVCAEIERLLEEALRQPSRQVLLADRVARVLIPCVLLLALGSAVWHWSGMGPEGALLTALSVVLIACPCALGIATPLAFWVALGHAWKLGILVRGGAVMEGLARAERIWLDKTGTLTDGELELVRIELLGDHGEDEALHLAASLEVGSEHPIGRSLRRAWARRAGAPPLAVEDFRALPGEGVEARVAGVATSLRRGGEGGAVRLTYAGAPVADFLLRSSPRPEARRVVAELRELGLAPVVLTGDGREPAERLARELDLAVESELLPADKVERIRSQGAERAIFVGDGLNDAAALAAAGVGVSVSGGSARSMDVAEVNLLRPGLGDLPELVRLARAATRTARWNLFWAFGYNAVALVFAVSGHLPPIFAALAMIASSLAVILNSGRLAYAGDKEQKGPRAGGTSEDSGGSGERPQPPVVEEGAPASTGGEPVERPAAEPCGSIPPS